MASNPPNSIANDLLDKFNNASSTTVALGTLGAVLGSYAFIKLFQNRRVIAGSVIKQARKVPLAKSLVNKQLTKDLEKLDHSLRIKGDTHVLKTLPETGFSHDQVLSIMQEYCDLESKWKDGKLSGCVYHGGKEHTEMMNKAYSLFSLTNPLHPDVFPSVKKFESEIVAMAVNMLGNVEGVCGAVTSGGTESILMAIKAHRDYFNIPNPEMIIPISAHPAFNKAASYFGIKLVIIPVGDDYRANVSEMRKAINKNTILLVASAPSFPHGMIDPVEEIAALADEFGIGCHVDCCLGGFFLPWITDGSIPNFDFRVKGVTSMSADTHKYGYSVKGTSVVLFKNEQIRRSMYFVTTEWPGGIYASPTISGSRPGGLIAATWASLVSIGQKGFYENVRLIMETQKIIKDGINKLEDVQLIGDSKTMVIAFTSQTLNIFAIYGEMHQRGWVLNALQNPSSVHICLTFAHNGMAEKFLNDLKESIEASRSKPKGGDEAHLYGLAYGFPDRSLVHEMVSGYLDVCLKA